MTTLDHDAPVIDHVIGDHGQLTIRLASAEVRLAGTTGDRVIVRTPNGRPFPDRVVVEAGDGDLTIREKDAGGLTFQIGGRRLVQLDVEVPADAEIHTDVTSGWVDAIGLTGEQHYRATSGETRLREASGEIDLNTVSGDATLELAAGTHLRVRAVSGDVRVTGGQLDGLRINTTSGDIRLDSPLVGLDENVIETLSGDVQVTISDGIRVEARTVSGDLMTDLPHRSDGRMGRRTLVIGDGAIPLKFRSVSGDLRIQDVAGAARLPTPPTPPTPPLAPTPPTPPTPPLPPVAPGRPLALPTHDVEDAATPPAAIDDGPSSQDDSTDDERMAILRALEQGELDVATAMERLAAIDDGTPGADGEDAHA